MTKPILEKLAQEYADRVVFIAINADDSVEVVKHLKIAGIPTVLAIRQAEVVGRVTGAQNEAGYRAMFEALVKGTDIKASLTSFDRLLRIGAGALLMIVGIFSSSWLVIGVGGIVGFLGIYGRCPIWNAFSRTMRKIFM
jgi:thiol-disulfide isomerase/thioredoxin